MNHLNQEPLDFAAAIALMRIARTEADRFRNAWDFAYKQAMENGARAAEALVLLRELNDALVIPGWLQPRVDAVLDGGVAEPTTRAECARRIDELHAEIRRVAWIAEGRPRQLPQEEKP